MTQPKKAHNLENNRSQRSVTPSYHAVPNSMNNGSGSHFFPVHTAYLSTSRTIIKVNKNNFVNKVNGGRSTLANQTLESTQMKCEPQFTPVTIYTIEKPTVKKYELPRLEVKE